MAGAVCVVSPKSLRAFCGQRYNWAAAEVRMKAAIYTKRSSGKVLEVVDIDPPVPKPNEVLITVRAASINPLDWKLKSHRPGIDVAGEVVSIGSDVTRFKPGDAVFGAGKGSFAEYARARESRLAA